MCFKPSPLRVNSWQVSIFFGATSCVMQSLREGFQTHFCRQFYQRWILAGARSSLKKSECRGATSETRTCSTHHNYDQLCKQDATASSATAKSLASCSGQNRNDKRRWYYNGIASPHSLHFGNKHPPWTIAVASHSVSFRVKRSRYPKHLDPKKM